MAQVALQTGATSDTWTSSATPTLNTPAGADTERQILIATWSVGGTVVAPSISGWTLQAESFITGSQNRTAVYSRVISGTVAAGTASPTFSAAVVGRYWAGSFNGIPVSIALTQDTSWSSPKTVPATSASEAESMHLVTMTSGGYPRSAPAVTGYTEVHDAYAFHTGGANGLWLGINRKDVGAGAVASSSWSIYDYTGATENGDRTIYSSIILGPVAAAAGAADISIDGEFPIPTTLTAGVVSGSLIVGGTTTATATLTDQNGDPIRNVVPVVGAISGGVFTATTFSATNASGQATSTLTGAVIGQAALTISVGAVYSNQTTITVTGDGSSSITAVDVTPATAGVGALQTQQFAAVVTGTGTFDDSVTWSVESGDGSIDSTGLFTASSTLGAQTVRATSTQDPTEYDEATVTVLAGSITCTWTQGGAALANTALDYFVFSSADVLIASGSTTTSGLGVMTAAVPGQYVGEDVLVMINNVAVDMITAAKIHAQQVVTVS